MAPSRAEAKSSGESLPQSWHIVGLGGWANSAIWKSTRRPWLTALAPISWTLTLKIAPAMPASVDFLPCALALIVAMIHHEEA
jgi:hypothetical protein